MIDTHPPTLIDLLRITCPGCNARKLRAELGRFPPSMDSYFRVSCPQHGVLLQMRLDQAEAKRWSRETIAQSN